MSDRLYSPLLPPNQTRLEASLANAAAMDHTPELLTQLWDAQRCPVQLLPWLAWTLSVDEWDEAWTETQKRAQVLGAIALHRKKGTPWAVKQALLRAGMEMVHLIERIDGANWAEFDAVLDVVNHPLTEASLTRAVALITAYKAARSHLRKLTISLTTRANKQLRPYVLEQSEVTVFPRLRTKLAAHTAQAGHPLAILETQSIEIYPR